MTRVGGIGDPDLTKHRSGTHRDTVIRIRREHLGISPCGIGEIGTLGQHRQLPTAVGRSPVNAIEQFPDSCHRKLIGASNVSWKWKMVALRDVDPQGRLFGPGFRRSVSRRGGSRLGKGGKSVHYVALCVQMPQVPGLFMENE